MMTSVEVLRSCPGLAFRDEGVDPPIRRLDRVCACFPGIDWSAAAGRSDPGKRRDFAGTTQDISIALVLLSAVLGAIFGSIIGFWIGDRYGCPLLLHYGSYID